MNDKVLHTLELDKILARLAGYTTFSAGAELARELAPSTTRDEADEWQRETAEARATIQNQMNISFGGAHDVRDAAMAATRGLMIEPNIFLDIRNTLRRGVVIKRSLGRMASSYPLLAEIANDAVDLSKLQGEIDRVLDDSAHIRDNASVQLAIIRRDLKVAFDRLQTRLQRLVSSSANQVLLQESLVTMRNGRYVIPLKAEHKGKIPGVVHDSSSSGATLFIEPLETLELNNRWRELQLDEEKEIRRILAALTDMVAQDSEGIVRTVEVLASLDLIFAKANYAEALRATQPQLVAFTPRKGSPNHPGSTVELIGARHPLLKGNVVPIDVTFDEGTYVLVVTGPNTGGKTVALKTVGLLCLMAQCGLQIPADRARLSVFEGVYADIGDEQSIEQSLSTFSSHMTNTIQILHECDQKSLILLDELGAGTDPTEGSALARAVLTHLLARRVTTMVTTHHPELKVYSVETPGVRNASVEFNLETLAPTYRLIIGLPGRSNALAIAKRLGLDDAIIEDARSMVATEDLIADDMLDEIHRTREDIRQQQVAITKTREGLEAQRAEVVAQLGTLEDERRSIIAAGRRNMQDELDEFRRELSRLRKDMRLAGVPLENLRAVQENAEVLDSLVKSPIAASKPTTPVEEEWRPRLGDAVWLETLKTEGTVVEIEKGEAQVQVGTLKIRAKLNDLKKPTRGEKQQLRKRFVSQYADESTAISTPRVASPGMELDLRGARVEDAIEKLEEYLNAAYLSNLPFARVIHGKGTGALRKAVVDRVREHPLVSRAMAAPPAEGGDGVTIVYMASQT